MIKIISFIEFLKFSSTLLIIIFLGTLLIVGVFLIIRAYQFKANNFYFIGFAWNLEAFAQIVNQVTDLPVSIYAIFSRLSFIFIIIFIILTFNKHLKSKKKYCILAISFILAFLGWFFAAIRSSSQVAYVTSRIFDFILNSIALDWLAYSCYTVYQNIKNSTIAQWVKMRYKITFIFSPILTLIYLILIFHPYNVPFGDETNAQSLILYTLTAIITLTYGISFVIAWIFPRSFKRCLSKDKGKTEEEVIEEDKIMELIKKQLSIRKSNGDH